MKQYLSDRDLRTLHAKGVSRRESKLSLCSVGFSDPDERADRGTAQVTLKIFDSPTSAADAFEAEVNEPWHIEPRTWPLRSQTASLEGWWDEHFRYTMTRHDPNSARTVHFRLSVYRKANLLITIGGTQDVQQDPTSMRGRVKAFYSDVLQEIHDKVVER